MGGDVRVGYVFVRVRGRWMGGKCKGYGCVFGRRVHGRVCAGKGEG